LLQQILAGKNTPLCPTQPGAPENAPSGLRRAPTGGEEFSQLGIRCPMLQVNPKMLPRLDELEADLLARRERAHQEGWLGEIDDRDLTLNYLRQKRDDARRIARVGPVEIGMPAGLRAEPSEVG
jgi:hypothetical protein